MAKVIGLFLGLMALGSLIFIEFAAVPLLANFGLGVGVAGAICLAATIGVAADPGYDLRK